MQQTLERPKLSPATVADPAPSHDELPVYAHLHDLMRRYEVKDLVNVTAREFSQQVHAMLGVRNAAIEGFTDPDRQDPLAVDFHWGHHHDFGEFCIPGRMCKHHMSVMAVFIDGLHAMPRNLEGMRVLDIGCWTGGTSLLLCAMGAQVTAVEEVRKYADCVEYLRNAFDVGNLEVKAMSLYDCTTPAFQDAYDIVLCPGVLHHCSDPKLALRIMFNCLTDGGRCLLETAATTREALLAFCGDPGGRAGRDPLRWNDLLFTPQLLTNMLEEVGLVPDGPCEAIRYKTPEERLFAVGRRVRHEDMRRSGLSSRAIR